MVHSYIDQASVFLETADKTLHEILKEKFGINMPQDFFDLWEFCKDINPQKPQGNLMIMPNIVIKTI